MSTMRSFWERGRLRARAGRHGDRGTTLIELVTVIFVLGIVLAAVQTTIIDSTVASW